MTSTLDFLFHQKNQAMLDWLDGKSTWQEYDKKAQAYRQEYIKSL